MGMGMGGGYDTLGGLYEGAVACLQFVEQWDMLGWHGRSELDPRVSTRI